MVRPAKGCDYCSLIRAEHAGANVTCEWDSKTVPSTMQCTNCRNFERSGRKWPLKCTHISTEVKEGEIERRPRRRPTDFYHCDLLESIDANEVSRNVALMIQRARGSNISIMAQADVNTRHTQKKQRLGYATGIEHGANFTSLVDSRGPQLAGSLSHASHSQPSMDYVTLNSSSGTVGQLQGGPRQISDESTRSARHERETGAHLMMPLLDQQENEQSSRTLSLDERDAMDALISSQRLSQTQFSKRLRVENVYQMQELLKPKIGTIDFTNLEEDDEVVRHNLYRWCSADNIFTRYARYCKSSQYLEKTRNEDYEDGSAEFAGKKYPIFHYYLHKDYFVKSKYPGEDVESDARDFVEILREADYPVLTCHRVKEVDLRLLIRGVPPGRYVPAIVVEFSGGSTQSTSELWKEHSIPNRIQSLDGLPNASANKPLNMTLRVGLPQGRNWHEPLKKSQLYEAWWSRFLWRPTKGWTSHLQDLFSWELTRRDNRARDDASAAALERYRSASDGIQTTSDQRSSLGKTFVPFDVAVAGMLAMDVQPSRTIHQSDLESKDWTVLRGTDILELDEYSDVLMMMHNYDPGFQGGFSVAAFGLLVNQREAQAEHNKQ